MNPGTKLLEVRRENDNLNNCYYTLASELGIITIMLTQKVKVMTFMSQIQ